MADRNKSVMEGVSLESAQVLVELIGDNSTLEKKLLKRRFNERARGFDETLKFMEGMQVLEESAREIRRARSLDSMQEALRAGGRKFNECITRLGVGSGNEIRQRD